MKSSNFFVSPTSNTKYLNLSEVHSKKGGFNQIFRAERDCRFFIIKALKAEFRGNPLYESLLKKESEIGFSLDHLHIVRTHCVEQFEEYGSAIVLEWIDGRKLDEYIAEGGHSKAELVRIISQLCDALSYAHKKQVIHRDIKPQNIIITYNGDNVKLIDFGLSDTDSHSQLKEPAGSRRYASPEMLSGLEMITNRSDIYSLGVVIDEMYCGRPSRGISTVISKCCRYRATERYHSCQSIASEVTKRTWVRYGYITAAAALIALGIIVAQNSMQLREIPTPTNTQDEVDNPEKYNEMATLYYDIQSKRFKELPTNIDPLTEIPNFKNDSIAYCNRDRKTLDSIFNTEISRKGNWYSSLVSSNVGAAFYQIFHENYITSFFHSSESIFKKAKDETANSLRLAAPKIVDNRTRDQYGDERQTADKEHLKSTYESYKITVLPYIIYRREELALAPLPTEFLEYYDSRINAL